MRTKSDIKEDICKFRERGYTAGECVYCNDKLERGKRSEKVIDIFDIHWKCYDWDGKQPYWKERLKWLLWELQEELKK